ncbi:uncharacterized protein PGTG_06521 [Puccinia graminis f. sp. tritici CRL 75-36-700-3]|uniref:Indoleamine 2,3-dioxygenase n=1 Tax=Puccinia graminis f. sp. tritici (strain CRL 75-36-700-3 / race SCCL) TaxID=418459 RepID=E3K900_PUCGT|nr:uncharacterized protein PGTG_06521 [Puccinia graminis f. sp. tritici CRL 75-36-700-3]EFP80565.1 hypothetical protein PGTG_06521 [Puccinia graminis f. sp. tritici CRL 75-36-700-3]
MGVLSSVLLPDSKGPDDFKSTHTSPIGLFDIRSPQLKPLDGDGHFEKSALQELGERSLKLDLGLRSGFLPSSPPVCRLDGPWARWEDALDAARGLHLGLGEADERTRRWRQMIREELPVVDIDSLEEHDVAQLRRAHLVLAFLMHFYVHSGKLLDESTPNQLEKIPKGIAVPLCAVSNLLDMPPVLTYADTVLYNWRLVNPAEGFTPDNIVIHTTFTNTPSEEHFFKTSLLVEVLGPTCLSLMKLAIDEAIVADTLSVTRIASSLLVLTTLIDRLRDSTLIHALDIFLGVDHRPHPSGSQTSSNPMKLQGVPSGEETFMARMAVYMPSHHRRFLSELAASLNEHSSKITTFPSLPDVATHSVRSLALASPATSDLRSSYNDCVAALGRLRSTHSKVVLLYIVSQSRHPPPEGSAFMDAWLEKQRLEAEKTRQPARAHLGTGGTDLAKFLKRCRERTTAALID